MKKSKKNKKGVALVYIIFIFVFVTLITTAMFSVYSNNFKQSYIQQKTQQAYYVALSGIELASTALLMEDEIDTNGAAHTLLEKYKVNFSTAPEFSQVVDVGGGKVEIKVDKVTEPSGNWVRIQCVGIIEDMNGKLIKTGAELKINPENEAQVQWRTYGVS